MQKDLLPNIALPLCPKWIGSRLANLIQTLDDSQRASDRNQISFALHEPRVQTV